MGQALRKPDDGKSKRPKRQDVKIKPVDVDNVNENHVGNLSIANGNNANTNESVIANNIANTSVFAKSKAKKNKDALRRKIDDLEAQLRSQRVSYVTEIEELRKEMQAIQDTANITIARLDSVDIVAMNLIGDQALLKNIVQKNTEQYQKTIATVVEVITKAAGSSPISEQVPISEQEPMHSSTEQHNPNVDH